ncbi:MAG: ribosome maturation factor RimP [Methylococcales bacterium]
MRQVPVRLTTLIEPIVTGLGYEFVGIEYNPHHLNGLLRVYIDSKNGIVVDDCSKVSHQLSGVMDVEDPIPGNYRLEVSSPGLDRPLFTQESFGRFMNRQVNMTLLAPIQKQKKIKGKLCGLEGDVVLIQTEAQLLEIPFDSIAKARLIPEL